MKRSFRPTGLAAAVVWVVAALAHGSPDDGIQIETRIGTDSVTVGERLRVSYTATYPDSLTMLPPGELDTGKCRLVSIKWHREDVDGKIVHRADLVVLPLDLERARMPRAPFRFLTPPGDTLIAFSDEVSVPVRQLTGAQSEQKPLKPQWEAPRSYFYYFLAGGLLLLAAALIWLWKRRKKPVVVEAPRPELPADFVALKALVEIEGMNLLEAGEFKKYYTLVVDTLRHYLERRYGIQAMDRTTDEILSDLQVRRLDVGGLEPLLHEADLVKFAKFKPDVAAGKKAIQDARIIVLHTTPRPAVAAGE